jgi:hypothetical protein
MTVKTWYLPIKAGWHRATELRSLSFESGGLSLVLLEEDSGKGWRLHFPEVQAFKCTTEQSAGSVLGSLPTSGAFYEVSDSAWLRELGLGKVEYMSRAKHYIVCCYDEVVEVVATAHTIASL